MVRLQAETIDRLIALLTLPVGVDEDDDRPALMEPDITRVSENLGWLVFEDNQWFDYDATRIEDMLAPWLDAAIASDFNAAALTSPAEFLTWVEDLVEDWRAGESGTAAPDADGAGDVRLGLANPYFEPDRIPGTEFYRYHDNEYLYAGTADAPLDQWKTLEERYDDHTASTGAAEPDDGRLRGYRYASSVLPGTEYYLPAGATYLYGPHEYGPLAAWQPYDYWQGQADLAAAAADLGNALDALIDYFADESAEENSDTELQVGW